MAVTQFLDGVPCTVKEAFDFSFLRQWGRVFRAFDQQDSGNLCFGLEKDGRRYFLKFAGARPICFDGEPGEAVRLLKKSAQVYRDLAHPILLPMLGAFAFELFSPAGRDLAFWPLPPAAWECAKKAASPQRADRFSTLCSFSDAWAQALSLEPCTTK